MAMGIMAALLERASSGQGQVLDVAMVDGASLYTSFMRGMHAHGLWSEEPGTNALDGAAAFYDTYVCSDGRYVAVGCVEPQFFGELVRLLGLDAEELPSQNDPHGWVVWRHKIAEALRARPRDEWADVFMDSDACVTPVLSPWEAHHHPHHIARTAFVEVDGVVQPAPAPRFSRTPAQTPVPADVGERDISATLADWGISEADTASLTATVAIA